MFGIISRCFLSFSTFCPFHDFPSWFLWYIKLSSRSRLASTVLANFILTFQFLLLMKDLRFVIQTLHIYLGQRLSLLTTALSILLEVSFQSLVTALILSLWLQVHEHHHHLSVSSQYLLNNCGERNFLQHPAGYVVWQSPGLLLSSGSALTKAGQCDSTAQSTASTTRASC